MFVTTSQGNTIHYEMDGPENGPLVVLVHGISIPSYSWDLIVPTLVQAGLRVLRYDVFGRGESSYPTGPYDRALLMSQLDELLRAVSPEQEKIYLAGFSFGGAMSALFASLNPSRVERLALVAPFARMSPQGDFRRTVRFPVLGELLMHFKLKARLLARGNKLLADAGLPAPCAQKFAAQLARPEFARAFLSLLRSDALNDYGPAFAAVAASGVMTALAWGTADDDITAESIAYTKHHLAPTCYEEMQGATHGSMLATSSGVGEFLVKTFLAPS